MVKKYELVLILDPQVGDTQLDAAAEKYKAQLEGAGASVVNVDTWGQRKLAYPIKRFFDGYYILHSVQMPPQAVTQVERTMRLNENIIRFLVIRKDEDEDE